MHPPASWRPVEPSAHQVPGVALAAWAGPEGSSLSLYRTLPVPGGSPAMIAEALANRLENLPGMRVVVHQTEKVGETTAARVEVVAPGTGNALAPSGAGTPIAPAGKTLVPTRQVTLGFHRPDATLFLTWVVPESSYDRIAPDIKATLETVRFTAERTTFIFRILKNRRYVIDRSVTPRRPLFGPRLAGELRGDLDHVSSQSVPCVTARAGLTHPPSARACAPFSGSS